VTAERMERRLAAVLAADVAGYSRLMGTDEEGTLARLKTVRKALVDPTIASHRGRIVKTTGDGMLVEFASAVDAVRGAVEVQRGMAERNRAVPQNQRIEFRIGIHVGDIIIDDNDIFGDGVNVAARLESIADPGGVCMSDDAYRQIRGKVDIAFGDMGPQDLKNIAEPVRAWRIQFSDTSALTSPKDVSVGSRQVLAVPEKPSIAVLPFQNMSGDSDQDYFSDGLVDDILTSLSKLAGLRVIARNSSFVYKGKSVDVREAAKHLGVQYILEGSVRKSGDRIRITTQLIDARDGIHLWAERYDRVIDDIFAVQDEITLILATEMQVRLTEGEQARLRYTTTKNVEAWTYWVQGLSHYRQSISKEKIASAVVCWEKALRLDPTSAALNAMLGFMHLLDARFSWWDDPQTAVGKAQAYIDRALKLDPDNADAYLAAGGLFWFERHFDEAVAHARRAVQLAPGSADVANLASFYLTSSGFPEEAVVQSKKAIALNPNYPPNYLGNLGYAHRLTGQVAESISAFKAYDARVPGLGYGLTDLIILYQQNGQPEEAKRTAERLLAARPGFTTASWLKTQVTPDAVRLEADGAALRAAGLPQG
jgi:adenylate cyclase